MVAEKIEMFEQLPHWKHLHKIKFSEFYKIIARVASSV